MSITILLLLIFTLLLLIIGWRNKYYVLFAALASAMTLSMFTLMIEVAKSSNYLVPSQYLFHPLETRLYALLYNQVHISLSTLMMVRNIGIVIYFFVLDLFVISFSRSIRLDEAGISPKTPLRYSLMMVFPFLFFSFYHPQTAYRFFRSFHAAKAQHLLSLVQTGDSLLTLSSLVYLLWPVLFLIINYYKGRMTFLSGFLLRLSGSLLALNLSFFMLFFTGLFRPSCADVLKYGFWRFTLPTNLPVFYTSTLPILMFILLLSAFVALMQLHADYILSFFKSHGIRKNLNALYANVRNVMHSEKNLLFMIRILIEDAMQLEDPAVQKEKLEKVLDLCGTHMDSLTRTLNDAHDMNVNTLRSDFISAVEAAVSSQPLPSSVRIERDFPSETLPLYFDNYHMTHALSNILSNSLDALATQKPTDPFIRISIYTSLDWVYISVLDNGCGIPADILHKVEQPYVSTKKKKNSWGIGLSYVYSVIRAHYGQMRIRSRQHDFTQVEILLPRSPKRR